MTHKVIHYTTHAADMMAERSVSRGVVRTILATGAELPVIRARVAVYHEKWLRIDGRNLGVTYVETDRKILIITVEILDWHKRG